MENCAHPRVESSALREHHPAPIEISSVASASVPRLASRANEVPLTGSLQERDLAMTLRWRFAYRLIEVGSLPDERERAGSLQSPVPPRAAIRKATFQTVHITTMEGRRKK